MPRLNSVGGYTMGIAGIQGSVNGMLIPDAYGPYWVNNDIVAFGQPSNGLITLMNVNTWARTPATPNGVHNDLRAGGGNWAAFLAVPANIFAPNVTIPDAGLLDVGPDGEIGFRTLYHSNYGCEVFEMSGERWLLNNTDLVYDLQLLGGKRAIWKDQNGHRIRTLNIPPCTQLGNAYAPKATLINGEWWVCYWSDLVGLVLHPFNSTIGYLIVGPGIDAFGHDAVSINSSVKTVWSTRQGELPQDYRERIIDTATEPRVQLQPTVVIPKINKRCWLTWFEFVSQLAYMPPGNSFFWVRGGGDGITKLDRTKFASWVQTNPQDPATHSVEYIEQTCQNTPGPCVAYWDSRVWPRLPNLKPGDWTALQWYCRVSETPQNFEMDLRNYLNTLPQDRKYCGVCQCYTDNNSLTKDLIGIVPVFAALARDYAKIDMLMPFNDQGRGNAQVGGGLQWNPQVKPYWEELFAGITGEPALANPPLPSEVCEALHRERNKYPTPPSNSDLVKILNDTAWQFPPDWGVNRKDFGAYAESAERPQVGKIAMDILHRRSDNLIWDVLIAAGESTGVNCGEALGEMTDPRRPWVQPEQPPGVGEPVLAIIYYNDPVARRSDVNGCLIKFEFSSARPIVRGEFYCEGNGENPVAIEFPVGPGFDGRYVRQIGVKFTVNGFWTLKCRGWNDQGVMGESDGVAKVEVTF